jgi:hypothetical protein
MYLVSSRCRQRILRDLGRKGELSSSKNDNKNSFWKESGKRRETEVTQTHFVLKLAAKQMLAPSLSSPG